MDDYLKKEICNSIGDMVYALTKRDSDVLKEISDRIVHSSSLYNDSDGITLGIASYSLAKVISRKKSYDFEDWSSFTYMIKNSLESALKSIQRDDLDGYRYFIKKLMELISHADKKMKYYVGDILRDAQVKKGNALYQEGLSIGLISDLVGVSEWELMNYVGKTALMEKVQHDSNVKSRLDTARRLFSKNSE